MTYWKTHMPSLEFFKFINEEEQFLNSIFKSPSQILPFLAFLDLLPTHGALCKLPQNMDFSYDSDILPGMIHGAYFSSPYLHCNSIKETFLDTPPPPQKNPNNIQNGIFYTKEIPGKSLPNRINSVLSNSSSMSYMLSSKR